MRTSIKSSVGVPKAGVARVALYNHAKIALALALSVMCACAEDVDSQRPDQEADFDSVPTEESEEDFHEKWLAAPSNDPQAYIRRVPRTQSPAVPSGWKLTCHRNENIDPIGITSDTCYVLTYQGVDYWAFSNVNNSEEMAITGFLSNGQIGGRIRSGARYLRKITLDGNQANALFWGQASRKITMALSDLPRPYIDAYRRALIGHQEQVSARNALTEAAKRFLPYLGNATWMRRVFGNGYSSARASELASQIRRGDFGFLPRVVLFDPAGSGAFMEKHRLYDGRSGNPAEVMGAYKTGVVYWSGKLLGVGANLAQVRSIAVQELAHHIESIVNPGRGNLGGEGVLAAAMLFGPSLSQSQIAGLSRYRDHADIFIGDTAVRDAELGFWRNAAIGAAAVVTVVVIVASAGALAPEVVAADEALLTAEAVTEGTAELAEVLEGGLEAGEEAQALPNTESTSLLRSRPRVYGNLNSLADLGAPRPRVFRSGTVARSIDETFMNANRSNPASLREYAIETISGESFSRGFQTISSSSELKSIYGQVATAYSFDPTWFGL